jgi:hypothetical protein
LELVSTNRCRRDLLLRPLTPIVKPAMAAKTATPTIQKERVWADIAQWIDDAVEHNSVITSRAPGRPAAGPPDPRLDLLHVGI